MRIALVTPYLPHPSNTGARIRVSRFAEALARQGQVQLFAALDAEDRVAETERAGRVLEPYERVVAHVMKQPGLSREAPAAALRYPDELVTALGAAHDASPFDVIVIAHSTAARAVAKVGAVTRVLDEHELRSTVLEQRLASDRSNPIRSLLMLYWWRRYERAVWATMDAITAARSEDAAKIRVHRPDTGLVIPNGVDANRYPYRPPSRRGGNTVLFVGNMAHPANVKAARMLVQEVMPLVRGRVHDASLTIAGRSPTSEVRALENDDVRVTGTLRSLAPLYDDHAVFAVPPVVESAMDLKVLEPLSCGMPLVAPCRAIRDLPLRENTHYLSVRTEQDAAGAIAEVLQHRERFDSMALAALQVAERLDWDVMGERFARYVLAAVVKKKKAV